MGSTIPTVSIEIFIPVTHLGSLWKFECKQALHKHTKPLNTLKLSKDARMLLSGGKFSPSHKARHSLILSGDDGQLLVWNVTKGSLYQAISVVFNGPVSAAIWTPISPESPTTSFAFGCADGRVFVYRQAHETVISVYFTTRFSFDVLIQGSYHLSCSISAHDNHIEALVFDMNHRCLASAGNGTAKVWQMDSEGQDFETLEIAYLNHNPF